MIPNQSTLVKYENPVLVTTHEDQRLSARRPGPQSPPGPLARVPSGFPKTPRVDGVTCPKGGDDPYAKREIEDVLNVILPPKEWRLGDQLWRQYVSSTPATRVDVIALQEQLDMRLKQRQARETGICPVRRELYSQSFDEVIRQVTINCAERGLLLLRCRDEIRMTMAAYQALYESSTAYGMRKALMSEAGKQDLEDRMVRVMDEKADLDRQCQELKIRIEQLERKYAEQRQAEGKRHHEEMQFLKRANLQLKQQLEGIIAPKKTEK